jgi:ABC-2 type transport system permease protein
MIAMLRAAFVIARRDYIASVWSRSFVLFLLGPLLPLVAGGFIGSLGAEADALVARRTVAVMLPADDARLLVESRARLARRLGDGALPGLVTEPPGGDPAALLTTGDRRLTAVMTGSLARPTLYGTKGALAGIGGDVGLMIDDARRARILASAGQEPPAPVVMEQRVVKRATGQQASARILTARVGQLILMMLTMILAGMLLSNLIEEKSNKVIEVLTAAVPVQAIFVGKLAGMLAMSLTGIAVWGGVAGIAAFALLPPGGLAAPAVGWAMFVALGVAYFIACYLLLGAVFLGIGAHASSVRQVQTLSMPVTMGQLGVVGLATTVVARPDSGVAQFATIFPWSSPFAMLARAAQSPDLWPHVLAIGWQALWVALIVRIAAAQFRRSVLKSGGPRRRWFRAKLKPDAA